MTQPFLDSGHGQRLFDHGETGIDASDIELPLQVQGALPTPAPNIEQGGGRALRVLANQERRRAGRSVRIPWRRDYSEFSPGCLSFFAIQANNEERINSSTVMSIGVSQLRGTNTV